MLKATAWPIPVFEDVQFTITSVRCGPIEVCPVETSKGYVIDCSSLRSRSDGQIVLAARIDTTAEEISAHVFGEAKSVPIRSGLRLLCKRAKFRSFYEADATGEVNAEIPVSKLRGIAQLDILCTTRGSGESSNGVSSAGSSLAELLKPIVLAVDDDWTGETIPVDWLDFASNQMPSEALIHVALSGGGQTPEVYLNSAFREQIEPVLLRGG